MSTARAAQPWTVEEFLGWVEWQDERYDLVDGQPYMMVRPLLGHQRIVRNLDRRLSERLDGHRCEPIPEYGVRTKIDSVRYPDVLIDCDPGENDERIANEPRVVFEVLSPTTRYVDVRAKVPEYQKVASIAHIVLIDVNGTLTVHDRAEPEWVERRLSLDDVLTLPALGIEVPVRQLFDRTTVAR